MMKSQKLGAWDTSGQLGCMNLVREFEIQAFPVVEKAIDDLLIYYDRRHVAPAAPNVYPWTRDADSFRPRNALISIPDIHRRAIKRAAAEFDANSTRHMQDRIEFMHSAKEWLQRECKGTAVVEMRDIDVMRVSLIADVPEELPREWEDSQGLDMTIDEISLVFDMRKMLVNCLDQHFHDARWWRYLFKEPSKGIYVVEYDADTFVNEWKSEKQKRVHVKPPKLDLASLIKKGNENFRNEAVAI